MAGEAEVLVEAIKPEHRCARSGFMVATHESSTLSGTGAVCLAHWCFWWQSMPWQRVMSLSTGTLQLGGDKFDLRAVHTADVQHFMAKPAV